MRAGTRAGAVDIVDDTFVRATPAQVRAALDARGVPADDLDRWPVGVTVPAREDRGAKGVRWAAAGRITGRMEIWLEPLPEGTLVHHYVRGEARHRWRSPAWVAREHTVGWKQVVHAVKDSLEGRSGG